MKPFVIFLLAFVISCPHLFAQSSRPVRPESPVRPVSPIVHNTEENAVKRLYNHILIHDIQPALLEVEDSLARFPNSKPVHEAYIKLLAESGQEQKMLAAWQRYGDLFDDAKKNRDIIEHMAWGIINKGATSTAPLTRIIALLASALSQDIKGVNILYENLHNNSSLIRGVAVQLSSHCLDEKLRKAMLNLFRNEKNWTVRLEVIQALGEMRILEAQQELESLIAQEKMAEEKAVAIEALVNMLDKGDKEYVARLALSDRAGLRLLACEVVKHFELKDALEHIAPLLNDPRADVRAKVLEVLGTLRIQQLSGKSVVDIAYAKINDTDPLVAITAAWITTLNDPSKGLPAFKKWFFHDNSDVRTLAAGALAATGKYGLPLTLEMFKQSKNNYVRLNLALGLISERKETKAACDALYNAFMQEKEPWMWETNGPFKILARSTLKHNDLIPQYPEVANQTVSIEILNLLAMLKYDKAQEAIKSFLKETYHEEITRMAMALILTEGDQEAPDLIKTMLNDNDPRVRLQAALILAMWSRDEQALSTLESSYAQASRNDKEKILEGIHSIASESSIPFLLNVLHESSPTLRLMAASGLIQCLNH